MLQFIFSGTIAKSGTADFMGKLNSAADAQEMNDLVCAHHMFLRIPNYLFAIGFLRKNLFFLLKIIAILTF